MKNASVSLLYSCFAVLFIVLSRRAKQWGIWVLGISLFMGLWGGGIPTAYAGLLKEELCIIRYDENCLQPNWLEDGAFSEILERDIKEQGIDHLAKQTNLELNNTLNGLAKKIRIRFSPKVVVKPFVIFEELQNMLLVYQSKKLKKNIQIDENFQAKSTLLPSQISQLKKIKPRRLLSVSPYQNRIYGLHIQIAW